MKNGNGGRDVLSDSQSVTMPVGRDEIKIKNKKKKNHSPPLR